MSIAIRQIGTVFVGEVSGIDLTRPASPEDVAAMLLFLCSDEGGAITGARIPVFGGN